MKYKVIILIAILTMGMSAYAADACTDEMGHQGDKRTIQENKIETVKGGAGTPAIDYEVWLQDGNGSLSYWTNGTFSAEWNGSNDFIARVGLKYDEPKTYDKFGDFSADFKFVKSGNAGYSYIGIYGRMENPAVEYYIADDWFSKPAAENLGTKIDEYELDGDTYELWQERRNTQPTIRGDMSFLQVVSVRKNARQCGHIDITAHFKKWEELGVKLGVLNEMKMLVEAGGESTGKIDFTYFKITETERSSDSQESSSSNAEALESSSSSETSKLAMMALPSFVSGTVQVFDMQGRYLGAVEMLSGESLGKAVAEKYQNPGRYLLKQNGSVKMVTVEF